METFASRLGFTTLHQPLEKFATRPCDAPMNVSSVLGSSGKGIRDDRNSEVFRRKARRRYGSFSCRSGMVGLRRWDECWRLEFDFQRHDGYASERHPSHRRQHSVLSHGHGKHEPGSYLVGERSSWGKFNSPSSLPSPNSVKIKATSVADTSFSATSPVTLQNPVPVVQMLTPTFLPVGNFSLTVGGSNFVSGSKVMFGATALATTYVSPTQLIATGTATSAQVGMVKITVQNPDPGKIVSVASLNVQVGAGGQVSVQVIPPTAQITAGSTLQYRVTVDGAGSNTAVKWAINGIPNGNATLGTIN